MTTTTRRYTEYLAEPVGDFADAGPGYYVLEDRETPTGTEYGVIVAGPIDGGLAKLDFARPCIWLPIEEARHLAAILTEQEQDDGDGWTYAVEETPDGTRGRVAVYDETGAPLGRL